MISNLEPLRYQLLDPFLGKEIPGSRLKPWDPSLDNVGTPRNMRALIAEEMRPEVTQVTDDAIANMWQRSPLQPWAYEWLAGVDYQLEALRLALPRKGYLLYHAPGAGKTFESVVWATGGSGGMGPVLVICPARIRQQFRRQYERFTVDVQADVLMGQTPQVGRLPRCPCSIDEWVSDLGVPELQAQPIRIIGWETLTYWAEPLARWMMSWKQQGWPVTVIFDEIHMGKSWKRREQMRDGDRVAWVRTQNQSGAAELISRAATRRLGLTATPDANTLMDLWSQLDLLEPGCWGTSKEFAMRYCDGKPGKYGGLDTNGRSNIPELKARLSQTLNYVPRDLMRAGLPPIRREVILVRREYQDNPRGYKRELKALAKRGSMAIREGLLYVASLTKITEVCDAAAECYNAGQKVFIFVGRHRAAWLYKTAIEKRIGGEVLCNVRKKEGSRGYEAVPTVVRDDLVRRYNEDPDAPAVFVGTWQQMGESIDGLQCTDLMGFAQPPYTPRQIQQAEGRADRLGRDRATLYRYWISEGTIDESELERTISKVLAAGEVLSDTDMLEIGAAMDGEDQDDGILAAMIQEWL